MNDQDIIQDSTIRTKVEIIDEIIVKVTDKITAKIIAVYDDQNNVQNIYNRNNNQDNIINTSMINTLVELAMARGDSGPVATAAVEGVGIEGEGGVLTGDGE